MSTHANMVKMTVTSVASSGEGTITLNAASTGFQTFGAAFGNADATVDILITEGTSWEVARDCFYDHSELTVTRGTWEDSSNGTGVVTFTSAAVVSVVATADSGRRWDSGSLVSVAASVTTADVTGVVGQMSELDISGLTAARSFVLPTGAPVNSRCGFRITAGYTAENYDRGLKYVAGTAETLNGAAAGVEVSRCVMTHEMMVFVCTAAGTWKVDYDGRTPTAARLNNTSATTLTHAVFGKIGLQTTAVNVGNLADTTNSRIHIRRAGTYALTGFCAIASLAADSRVIPRCYKNDANFQEFTRAGVPIVGTGVGSGASLVTLSAGDYVELWGRWDGAPASGTKDTEVSDAAAYSFLSLSESI